MSTLTRKEPECFWITSLRTGRRATIITTGLPFTRWEEVLKDKALCSTLVDRLCHKSYHVNMAGTSYRIKETIKIQKITYNRLLEYLQHSLGLVYYWIICWYTFVLSFTGYTENEGSYIKIGNFPNRPEYKLPSDRKSFGIVYWELERWYKKQAHQSDLIAGLAFGELSILTSRLENALKGVVLAA